MSTLHFRPNNDHDALLESWASQAMASSFSPERLGLTSVRFRYKDQALTLHARVKGEHDTYARDCSWSPPMTLEGMSGTEIAPFFPFRAKPKGYALCAPHESGALLPEFNSLLIGDELETAVGGWLFRRHMESRNRNWVDGLLWQLTRRGVIEYSQVRAGDNDKWVDKWRARPSGHTVVLYVPHHITGPRGRVYVNLRDRVRAYDNQRYDRVPIRMIPGDEAMLQQLAEVIERLRDLVDAGALAEVLG